MSLLSSAAFVAVPGLNFTWRMNLPAPVSDLREKARLQVIPLESRARQRSGTSSSISFPNKASR